MSEFDENTRATLLADILANPDDDGPRLVLADWLSQRGDPRGELISVQCLLESTSGGARAKLVNRSSDILYRHGTWLREYLEIVRGVETKRGFVHAINATASVFANHVGPLFDREPIEELRVIAPQCRDLTTLAKTPHLAKLRAVVLLDPVSIEGAKDVAALVSFLVAVVRLRMLDLRLAVAGGDVAALVADLVAGLQMAKLEKLKLRVSAIDEGAHPRAIAEALAKAKLPALRHLTVRRDAVTALRAAFPAVEIAIDA